MHMHELADPQLSLPQEIEYLDARSVAKQTMLENGSDALSHCIAKERMTFGLESSRKGSARAKEFAQFDIYGAPADRRIQ